VPVEETIRAARALRHVVGVSRVTDITRLDRLGLPVYASIRPRSSTLRVHAGKGIRSQEAEAGALMEAVEHWAAEPHNNRWQSQKETVGEIANGLGHGLSFVDLVPILGAVIGADRVVSVVECEQLGSDVAVKLPAELVFFPFEDAGPNLFGASANGLASGNDIDEATLHGVLEVLERDAISMNSAHDVSAWIEHDELPAPFGSLASSWSELGVNLGVRYVENAFGMPCFTACLHERNSTDVNLAGGFGLHLDRSIALSRAICEAAQSRLSYIHGGRDDITPFYGKYSHRAPASRSEAEEALVSLAFDRRRTVHFREVPTERRRFVSVSEVLSHALARIRHAGFPSVLRFHFEHDLPGLCVVKVVIPKCEDMNPHRKKVGPRLLARILNGG
jgi:ribosomal protein S12 methylthiotransferase accessory factor